MMKTRFWIIIYISITFILFLLPSIFIDKISIGQGIINEVQKENQNISDTKVNLYLSKTNENIELDLEEYIKGVVSAEMPATYEMEALKAQAVIARTYTLNKINQKKQYSNEKHPNSDICDDIYDCQAYISKEERLEKWSQSNLNSIELWDKIQQAVESTKGEIILYNNEPIKAFFHANSGGKTEDVELVWKGEPIDYLKSVETAGENNYSQYSSNVEYTYDEFNAIMNNKYPGFKINFEPDCIKVIERSNSNRILKIKIGNVEISGVDARNLFSLKSTNFETNIIDGKVKFNVIGYGHGIGMSQTGSNELAKSGYDYKDIIYHYYTNVEVKKQ